MKKLSKTLAALAVLAFVFAGVANAQNQQNYEVNKAEAAHYIDLSRKEVKKNNLPLAKVYAQKAIQANAWDKLAWANYDDVIQRIADEGDIMDFGTALEKSKAAEGPKPGSGAAKFEGC